MIDGFALRFPRGAMTANHGANMNEHNSQDAAAVEAARLNMHKHVGLIGKYHITKADGRPVDPGAEYFVLRLDDGGGDPVHVAACRHAVITYACHIAGHLPRLADDLRNKYGQAERTPPAGNAAAIEAIQSIIYASGMEDSRAAAECCDRQASAILTAIREGKVPTLYHISQIPGCREFESRYDKDQKEIAALRARCEAAERDASKHAHDADTVRRERDAAIAAKEKAIQCHGDVPCGSCVSCLHGRLSLALSESSRLRDMAKRGPMRARLLAMSDERDALRARVAEHADVIAMHERDLSLCIDERNAAHAEVAKKDATITRLAGLLREARQHISDCINEEIDTPPGLYDRIVAALAEVGGK